MTYELSYRVWKRLAPFNAWKTVPGIASSPYTITPLPSGKYDVTVQQTGVPATLSAISNATTAYSYALPGVADIGYTTTGTISGLWTPAPYWQRFNNQLLVQLPGPGSNWNFLDATYTLNGSLVDLYFEPSGNANVGVMLYIPPIMAVAIVIDTTAYGTKAFNVPAIA